MSHFASYMGFIVYQMDVKSAFMSGTIDEEVKKSWCDEFEELTNKRFQMSSMGELTFFLGLQVKQKRRWSMIGSLMYLTASRSDIMFAVCACSGFQVTPKSLHLQAVKRIFRYLKGQPKLGLWNPKVSSFDLKVYSDSDYAGVNLDRKSITEGCQFLGRRLISWQCKKQTIAATSTTEVVYVAAAHCCGHVLWIQDQLLDYGFNLMNTQIYIYNESIICIVKNPVFHSKIKHIEIRHHFIRDTYEKKLIHVLKIHTDDNVVDLLTKAFDVSSTGRQQLSTARHKVSTASISKITPLFPSMLTQAAVAEGEDSGTPTKSQPTPSSTQPSAGDQPPLTESSSNHASSQDHRVDLEGTGGSGWDQVNLPYDSPLSGGHTFDRAEGSFNLEALSALCTNLSNRILALETIKDA
nr:putative ribonuclease H-like domain-containing protein [Tanacetum cinerariifolium]